MLWKAGYGHCRSRWHYASRVIFSLGGRGDNRVQVCDGLAPAQSCTPLFLYKCGSLAARANGAEGVRESVADLFGHSLTAKGGNRVEVSVRALCGAGWNQAFLAVACN